MPRRWSGWVTCGAIVAVQSKLLAVRWQAGRCGAMGSSRSQHGAPCLACWLAGRVQRASGQAMGSSGHGTGVLAPCYDELRAGIVCGSRKQGVAASGSILQAQAR
jgi:hypothetical protein